MTGRLGETSYASVKEQYHSDQQSLSAYGDINETTIAVVRRVGGSSIDTYCDEHMPELGMPEKPLTLFRELRAGYQTNSAVDDPHNKAFDDANLAKEYHDYINESTEALHSINEISHRLNAGENITLVCFENAGHRCHRHLLIDLIIAKRESSESEFVFVRDERKARQ